MFDPRYVHLSLYNVIIEGVRRYLEIRRQFILTKYVEKALSQASYDKLVDGTYTNRIPSCKGVMTFGNVALKWNSVSWLDF